MKVEDSAAGPDAPAIALPIGLRLGGKRGRVMGALQAFGMVCILMGVASIPTMVVVATWLDRQATWAQLTAGGYACPVVGRISPAARGAKPPRPFRYLGVGFARQIGDADCVGVPDGLFRRTAYPVCQFDAPAAIAVTAGGRTVIFEPGVGHSATIEVRPGQAACRVGGTLTS